ncbi:glycosyltransferase [Eggerthellaceae bacterium zg-1084]|uniref:glycosyltransferase family 2 protein n=1 Tax=Berryella wangjianweii TaxID=2734634 RepID=UPI001555315B|nr:glycosyltransferase [Berryella wangjianweii]NPD31065.1 glycosyltransferase [Berryella wangjianweii]
MNPLVVIPTFISARRSRPASSVVAVYDHATPLSQEGELPRCLESLTSVRGLGHVVVLVASEPGIEDQALAKVRRQAAQFPTLPVAVMGAPELDLVQQRFEQLGIGRLSKEVGLTGYAALRNFGLVVANAFGFDAVVFLDDDAVVSDEDFLERALYGLGKLTRKGVPILAKSGFYYNAQGTYRSQSQERWYDRFWGQARAFNAWIERAMAGPRLSRSNHVCGGCLALHREAFRRVAFDPWIARGEDLDYLLNLRMYGSDLWFDNQWSMRHLPPATASEGDRFRQDIFRWLYENRKIEYSRTQIDLLQVKSASLEPYPGPFLEPGIDRRVRLTALLRSLGRQDRKAYLRAAKAVQGEALSYAQRNCMKYFEFQYAWPELMARVECDAPLRDALLRSIVPTARPQAAACDAPDSRGAGSPAGSNEGSEAEPDAQAAARPAAAVRGLTGTCRGAGIDPGATAQIRLDLAEGE